MLKTTCTFFQSLTVRNFKVILFLGVIISIVPSAYGANIILSPANISTRVGQTFIIDVLVNDNKDVVNAASGLVTFPADVLAVTSISKSGSFINLWAEEPSFSNLAGTISFEGVALNPGFAGATGKLVSITFKAKQAGNISILTKSGQVLANDGNATNVLGTLSGAFVIINEASIVETETKKLSDENAPGSTPIVTSSSYPDSTKWYKSRESSFEWAVPSPVVAVRTLYSEKEKDAPSKVFDPPISNRSFTADSDGIMYMHVQFKNGDTWGPVAHYKFQIDSEAPEALSASFPDGVVTTNITPALLIQAKDKLSGIDYLTMSIDGGEAVKYQIDPSNLYHLPKQVSGKHTVLVGAVDLAGNSSTVSLDYTIQAIALPIITEYTKKVDFQNQFKIAGTTYPQGIVEVSLINEEGKIAIETTMANDTGVFRLIWPRKIDTGIYDMRARVFDAKGGTSDYTNSKAVIVEHIALIRFGIFIMNWLSVLLILILGAVAVAGTFWYSVMQFSRFRKKIRRTVTEVENTLKTNVEALKRDTEEFHTILVKAEKKRQLTKEEQTILKKFKKRLEITEKEIDRKLDEII
jgi:hypothetical protein